MKAIKFLGLTLLLARCTLPQTKDYYEIVGELKALINQIEMNRKQ